jgi:hypothetical protein
MNAEIGECCLPLSLVSNIGKTFLNRPRYIKSTPNSTSPNDVSIDICKVDPDMGGEDLPDLLQNRPHISSHMAAQQRSTHIVPSPGHFGCFEG